MVVGFDMVNEEDFTPPIDHFLDQIYAATERAKKEGTTFNMIFHCGETNDQSHT